MPHLDSPGRCDCVALRCPRHRTAAMFCPHRGNRTLARAWRGRGAGFWLRLGMSGAGVARAWRAWRGHVLFPQGRTHPETSPDHLTRAWDSNGEQFCTTGIKKIVLAWPWSWLDPAKRSMAFVMPGIPKCHFVPRFSHSELGTREPCCGNMNNGFGAPSFQRLPQAC
eukprot:gene15968-biopygen21753